MSKQILSVHHVGIVVRNIEKSSTWYRDHLGFVHQYDFSFPGVRASLLIRGDARLEFFQVEGAASMADERQAFESNLRIGGINHLALGVNDLDATIATLEGRGVEVASPPRDVPNESADRFAFIFDNERMLVELFQPA